jgi:RNA polymerase sigma-70 factor (ECF subfamily)
MAKEAVLTLVPAPQDATGQEAIFAALSDDQLVKLIATGAAPAFRELVRRYQGRVISVCVRSTGNVEEAREIAQEVFLAVWQAAPRYVPNGALPSFLFTIVRNQLRSAARRRGRESAGSVEGAVEPPTDAHSLERLLLLENERRLRAALQEIPEVHRQALLLRFSAELSYEEIAALCEAPEGTVRSWVHHGIKKLRGLMGEGA